MTTELADAGSILYRTPVMFQAQLEFLDPLARLGATYQASSR
jgi:hypothetical protein